MPRNSLVNGKVAPDSFGTQLDETAYPILMAYQLGLTDASLYADHIKPAANFVAARGPAFGVERWEEQSGFSPSTIAAEIAGLVAAAELARANGDAASAAVWLGVADAWQRQVKGWTVTTSGPLAARYFIRLSKTGDPNAAISYNVGNGGPTLDQRAIVDAGFLELVRLGLLRADDPDVVRSLAVVDATIKSTTATGQGWHRYNGDGYGDRAGDGRPWAPSGQGTGHLWPALAAERGEQEHASGQATTAASLLLAMSRSASGVGLIPEQNWELPDLAPSPYGTDPTVASIGFVNGEAAGSASPLTWSAASFVRLAAVLAADRNVVLPEATHSRYVAHSQGETTLTVTSPADNSSVGGSPVTVTGTTAPGNAVYVAATNIDANSATTVASATAAPDGSFSIDVAVTGGTSVLNVVAVSPSGATAHARRTVFFDFVPGTLLLDVTDPDGDDNGPGNFAYPTSDAFHPGAFDIQAFRVYDSGADVTFRLKTRDLSETFGSPLGAQLVDVYVHVPGAPTTSTASAHPLRNFSIAPAFAWSRLIQVQGFGQRYVDASGSTLGTVSITANPISRFITFSVPKASLGTPGAGWGFTVVLAGQDGFSPDQARGFAPTPQPFQFGVCAAVSADPRCTFDPGSRAEDDRRDHGLRCPAVDDARLHARTGRADRRHSPLGALLGQKAAQALQRLEDEPRRQCLDRSRDRAKRRTREGHPRPAPRRRRARARPALRALRPRERFDARPRRRPAPARLAEPARAPPATSRARRRLRRSPRAQPAPAPPAGRRDLATRASRTDRRPAWARTIRRRARRMERRPPPPPRLRPGEAQRESQLLSS